MNCTAVCTFFFRCPTSKTLYWCGPKTLIPKIKAYEKHYYFFIEISEMGISRFKNEHMNKHMNKQTNSSCPTSLQVGVQFSVAAQKRLV